MSRSRGHTHLSRPRPSGYRFSFLLTPILRHLFSNWKASTRLCHKGQPAECLDAFRCRYTHSRCRLSRPRRTTQEITGVRSPTRTNLTAVPLISKCMVREPTHLDKCGFVRVERGGEEIYVRLSDLCDLICVLLCFRGRVSLCSLTILKLIL